MGNVKALDIANFLNVTLIGEDIIIDKVSSLNNLKSDSLAFIGKSGIKEPLDKKVLYLITEDKDINKSSIASYIKVENPRLSFAKVVNKFFTKELKYFIDKSVQIGKDCNISKNVKIAFNSIIGDNVSIDHGTVINNNVIIYDNTIIGKDCYIKSNSIIGEDGFGFDFEEDGTPIKIPHLGKVIIGNNVEIGAKNTIARGTLDDTIIRNCVKIDDQVHIAHNCYIDENTIITACVEISGSVIIGKNCWIAPNVSIIQKINIGDNVKVGIGSVVISDILDNKTVMGLDAIEAIDVFRFKKKNSYGNNKLKDRK